MEVIKKTIERIMTTGANAPCSYRDPETGILITGCTATTKTIVPDLTISYYFKINLVQNAEDIGFFDAYVAPPLSVLTVVTSMFNSITKNSAIGGGSVLADGGKSVTDRGIVYSTNPNPTTGNSRTHNGTGVGPFISPISGLTTGTTYYARAYAINADGLVYGEQVSFETAVQSAIVTKPITAITTSGATSGGEISTDGGSPIIRRGIVWNTNINPTIANNSTINGYGIGDYVSYLTGLTTLTTYYVRAYATNMTETAYGNELSFMTIGLPSVSTAAITSIGAITATGGGNVTSEGGTPVIEKGIVWSMTSNPTLADTVVPDGSGLGTFTSSITGLIPLARYYVRAYATNIVGTAYGNEVTFDTITVPVVITSPVTDIQQTTAKSGGNVTDNGGSSVTEKGVQFGNVSGAYTRITNDGTGNGLYVSNMTLLAANGTYYVRAYATNFAGTGYGVEYSFTTQPIPPPSITAWDGLDTRQTTALIRANIVNATSYNVTTRGVVYSTTPGPTISNAHYAPSGAGNGTFDTTIGTGTPVSNPPLMPGYTYYVRAYLFTNETDYIYSNELTIVALPINVPTLNTGQPTNITSDGATSGGININDGGGYVTTKGIQFGTSPGVYTRTINAVGTGSANFTVGITGLHYNTMYYNRAFATNSAGTGYGNEIAFATLPVIPIVTTSSAGSVGTNSAILYGYAESGGATITSRGFEFRTSSSAWNPLSAGSGDGGFSATLGSLPSGTLYYYRALATNSVGTGYGTEMSFTTTSATPPEPQVAYILDTTMTTAIVRSGIVYSGSHVITERGVVYATFHNPDTSLPTRIAAPTGGITVWDTTITGLAPNQTYYVRAYAITAEDGTTYSTEKSFTTLAPTAPTLGTLSVASITSVSADGSSSVTSDGGAYVTQRGFVWSTTSGPTTANSKVTSGSGTGAFSTTMFGMYFNTTYYARAYAINSAGTSYSNEVSFTTAPTTPIVSTQGVTSISANYATGNGTIESNGGSPITSRGFVMGLYSGIYTVFCNAGSGDGIFYTNLGPFAASTTYYVRACATNAVGTVCGSETSFTSSAPAIPSVTLAYINGTSSSTAFGRAGITSSYTVLERGTVYAPWQNPDLSSYNQPAGSGGGSFDINLSGLMPTTTYYARAYIRTAEYGYAYSDQKSFVTL